MILLLVGGLVVRYLAEEVVGENPVLENEKLLEPEDAHVDEILVAINANVKIYITIILKVIYVITMSSDGMELHQKRNTMPNREIFSSSRKDQPSRKYSRPKYQSIIVTPKSKKQKYAPYPLNSPAPIRPPKGLYQQPDNTDGCVGVGCNVS